MDRLRDGHVIFAAVSRFPPSVAAEYFLKKLFNFFQCRKLFF